MFELFSERVEQEVVIPFRVTLTPAGMAVETSNDTIPTFEGELLYGGYALRPEIPLLGEQWECGPLFDVPVPRDAIPCLSWVMAGLPAGQLVLPLSTPSADFVLPLASLGPCLLLSPGNTDPGPEGLWCRTDQGFFGATCGTARLRFPVWSITLPEGLDGVEIDGMLALGFSRTTPPRRAIPLGARLLRSPANRGGLLDGDEVEAELFPQFGDTYFPGPFDSVAAVLRAAESAVAETAPSSLLLFDDETGRPVAWIRDNGIVVPALHRRRDADPVVVATRRAVRTNVWGCWGRRRRRVLIETFRPHGGGHPYDSAKLEVESWGELLRHPLARALADQAVQHRVDSQTVEFDGERVALPWRIEGDDPVAGRLVVIYAEAGFADAPAPAAPAATAV